MADGIITLNPGSAGAIMDVESVTFPDTTVRDRERVRLAGASFADLVDVTTSLPGTTAGGLVVRPVNEDITTSALRDAITKTGATVKSLAAITEHVGPAVDSVVRVASFHRNQNENVGPATDSASRTFVANRTVTETLSSGGGGTTVISPIFIFDD